MPSGQNSTLKVAIAGAGAAGLVTAVMLARAGVSVAVHEKAADFSASAAWRAGGMLAPECEADGSSPSVVALGRRGLALWPGLYSGVVQGGSLVLANGRDINGLQHFARRTEHHGPLDADGIAALEPALAGRFQRGLFFASEGHLEPRKALAALAAELAQRKVPVAFGWNGALEDLPAGHIVDARGLGSRDRLASLRGVKGEMAVIRQPEITLSRPVRLLHHRHPLYIVPRADHHFMIGATTIENEAAETVSVRSAGELLTQAVALHPAFGEADIIEFNAGLRPAFPDNEPRVETTGHITSINGLYRHGWLIAPALAEQVMAAVLKGQAA